MRRRKMPKGWYQWPEFLQTTLVLPTLSAFPFHMHVNNELTTANCNCESVSLANVYINCTWLAWIQFTAVGEVLLLHSITMHKVWQEITVWQSCECFCEAFLARADPQTKAAWLIWYIVQFWYLSDIEIIYILQEKPSIIERAASEKTNNVICHIIHGRGENISDGNFHKSKLFVHINKSNQRLHNRKSK